MQKLVMLGVLACAGLASPGVANAADEAPTCSEIRETAHDLRSALRDLAFAVEEVEYRSHVQWLAMSAGRSLRYILDEANRIRNIYPRDDDRCGDRIQRFRNYTERQFCPRLLALREAFQDDPELGQEEFVFEAWRDMVENWETYRDTVGVVGCVDQE